MIVNVELFSRIYLLNGSVITKIFFNKDEAVLSLCIRASEDFCPGRIAEGTLVTINFTDVVNCSFDNRRKRNDRIVYTEAFSNNQLYIEGVAPDGECYPLYIHAGEIQVIPYSSETKNICKPAFAIA